MSSLGYLALPAGELRISWEGAMSRHLTQSFSIDWKERKRGIVMTEVLCFSVELREVMGSNLALDGRDGKCKYAPLICWG